MVAMRRLCMAFLILFLIITRVNAEYSLIKQDSSAKTYSYTSVKYVTISTALQCAMKCCLSGYECTNALWDSIKTIQNCAIYIKKQDSAHSNTVVLSTGTNKLLMNVHKLTKLGYFYNRNKPNLCIGFVGDIIGFVISPSCEHFIWKNGKICTLFNRCVKYNSSAKELQTAECESAACSKFQHLSNAMIFIADSGNCLHPSGGVPKVNLKIFPYHKCSIQSRLQYDFVPGLN